MDKKMATVIKVMESLVKFNNWKVERFDIQAFNYGHGIEGYAGYLKVEGHDMIIVRGDGSFEYRNTEEA